MVPARSAGRLVAAVLAVNAVGAAPSLVSSSDTPWFRSLEKPAFYPPEIAFPVVWTILFTLLGIAVWLVWERTGDGRRLAFSLFALQMVVNVAWTPAFFSLQAPGVALGIIAALWALVVATIAVFARIDRRAAALLVPYLAWITFAAALNAEIWRLN